MKSKMKKILAILLMVCLVVPSFPSRVAEATDKSIDEFVTVSNSTTAVNYGNNAYNGSQINKTMQEGALFVIHTKVKGTLEGKTGPQISYTGWGDDKEYYHSEFRRDSEDGEWWFRVESQQTNGAWPTEIEKTYLSESQCNKIKAEGLDLYLVKIGTSSYAIYMENADLTEVSLVGTWDSRKNNTQIYEIKNNKQELVTTGYFYQGYTAEEVVKALSESKEVDKTNISKHVTTQGLEDSYRLGDTITFTAVASGEYAIQEVKINGEVLSAKEDGTYEYLVTVADINGIEVEVTTSKKIITEFVAVSNSSSAVNFGNNTYNGSKINTTMTNGAVFVLHTRLKATLEGNAQISYTGYGSGYWEKFYSEFRKDDIGWYFQLESENQYGKWYTEIQPQYLSESQYDKIKAEGLDLYLVKTGTSSYAIYMENADLTGVALVGEWTSRAASPQIYEVKNNIADSITTGYFYQEYTAEEVVKTLYEPKVVDKTNISQNVTVQGLKDLYRLSDTIEFNVAANEGYVVQEVKINNKVLSVDEDGNYEYLVTFADGDALEVNVTTIKKQIKEFVTITDSTSAVNFGNNTYNGSKINTTMTNGAVFVLHTRLKATLEGNAQISYTGYGSGYWEKFYSEFRKDDTGWFFQLESENQYQKWYTEIAPQYLSETQCNKIKNEGLDLYLVKTGTASYAIYMENADLTDVALVGEWTSRAASPQIYEVKNNTVDSFTTGYFYQGYTAEETVQKLYESIIVNKTNISKNIEVQGLADSYRIGDTIEFRVVANAQYGIGEVKINNKVLVAQGDGTYQYRVAVADGETLDVSVTVIARSVDDFVTVSNSTSAVNFGGNTYQDSQINTTMSNGAVFVLHTKVKATLSGNTQISYTGYGSGYWEKFHSEFRKDDTGWFFQLESENQYQKWYKEITPQYLSESQCNEIKGEGLDLYLVKTGTANYAIYMENADLTDVILIGEWTSRAASPQIYEVKNNTVDSVTNGYFYQGYTAKEIVSFLRTDIPIQITVGEHVSLENLDPVCYVGDYLTFAPATETGYAVTSLTVNGTKLTPDANGMYHYAVTLEHMDGLTVEVEAGKAFESFVALTGAASNQHGDKFDKFIYHIKVQGDLSVTGEKYVNVNFYTWGKKDANDSVGVGDSVCVRINVNNDGTATVLLGKYYAGTNSWDGDNNIYKLNQKQVKKIKGSGLNLYIVHEGTDSKTFDVYVEDVNSSSVSKILTIDAYFGDHVYRVAQTKKDGASVTTIGYQYADFLNSTTAPTELFWVEQNANTGDVNDDGKVSVADIIRAKKYANNVTVDSVNVRAGDINQNRTLKEDDMNGLRNKVLSNVAEGQYVDYYDGLDVQTSSTNPALNGSLFYNNVRSVSTVYGADPAVMEITKSGDKNHGKYIMVVTGNSTNQSIPVYIGTDLANWTKTGTIEIVNENGEPAADVATSDLWAMEMIYDETENKYYLFFSATPTTPNSAIEKVPYVAVGDSYTGNFKLINHSDYKYADNTALTSKDGTDKLGYASYLKYSAFDPYQMGQALTNVGLVSDPTAKPFAAIDMHPFVASDGEKYLYLSITSATSGQVILGVKMTDWETPEYDTLTVLTKNKYSQVSGGSFLSYERNNTNEGPWMTEYNGKYYLTFSINDYTLDNYKVIQAVADSPLGTFRKLTVEEGGILLGADRIGEISGPGHHSLIEKNGELYIVYHVHEDPTNPSYKRYIVMNKVEWVTNANGLEVMYVNGPTLASIQPLPEFASGYKNIASSATVEATNSQDGNLISGLTDKVWNSKGSTWKGSGSSTGTFFGDTCAKDVEFSGESTITMNFEDSKTIRALMIYNSSDTTNAFDEIERIEFVCADGSKKYINHLGFDFTANTYTLADNQGVTTGDDKFICGASVAEFNEMSVTEIRITVKPGTGKSSVALGEIVVLGKN